MTSPTDHSKMTIILSDHVFILDSEQRSSFIGRKKAGQAKERFCELVREGSNAHPRLFLRVYKIKANKNIPWIALEVEKVASVDS
jgi:hypothetical protein